MKEGEVWGLTPKAVKQLLQDAGFEVTTEQRFMLGVNRLTIGKKPAGEAKALPQYKKAI
jgi:hypothetical protein